MVWFICSTKGGGMALSDAQFHILCKKPGTHGVFGTGSATSTDVKSIPLSVSFIRRGETRVPRAPSYRIVLRENQALPANIIQIR